MDTIATLMDRHGRRVFRAAKRVCRDDDEAEDVLQSVFLRLVEDDALRDRVAAMRWPGGYLARMGRNLALDRVKSRRREADRIERIGPRERSPSETIDRDALLAAVGALPDAERRVVVLHHLMGRSYAQTAALLGISQGTVGANLHRAMRRLRDRLEGTSDG